MALIAILILVISDTVYYIEYGWHGMLSKTNKYVLLSFVQNFVIILFLVFFLLNPEKVGVLSVISFYYSVSIFICEPGNMMALFMYFLSISSLYARGYFNKNRKVKNIIAICFLLILIFSEVRFGKEIFIKAFIQNIGFSFVFGCSLFFIFSYAGDLQDLQQENNKLNIHNYPDLKKRDADWLVKVQKGEKYGSIAIDEKMSVGSVKNRFKIIFDELGVGDRKGFLNKYSDYEIFYEE